MNASHLYIQSGFTCTKMNFPAYNVHGMKTSLHTVYSVIENSDITEASLLSRFIGIFDAKFHLTDTISAEKYG